MLTTITTVHEKITQRVIEAIEGDQTPPWRKEWQPAIENSGHPTSPFSNEFTGIAILLLNLAATEQGLLSKYWSTEAAWKSIGGEVSRNGTLIPHRLKPNRWITVFNADTVSGGEVWRFQSRRRATPLVADYSQAEKVIKASGATIHHRLGMEAAYYFPPADYIVFPLKSQFLAGPGGLVGYFDSLFHELIHATEPRLGWECSLNCIRELRSEMAAPLLASRLDIPVLCEMHKIANHRNHLGRWIAAMRDDPLLVFQIAADASQAVEYLLSLAKAAAA